MSFHQKKLTSAQFMTLRGGYPGIAVSPTNVVSTGGEMRFKVTRIYLGSKNKFGGLKKGYYLVVVIQGRYNYSSQKYAATATFYKEGCSQAQVLQGTLSRGFFSGEWSRWGISVSFEIKDTILAQVNANGVFSTTIDWTKEELAEQRRKAKLAQKKANGQALNQLMTEQKSVKPEGVNCFEWTPAPLPDIQRMPEHILAQPLQSALYPERHPADFVKGKMPTLAEMPSVLLDTVADEAKAAMNRFGDWISNAISA